MPAVFDAGRCKGCGLCLSVCPKKIIVQNPGSLNGKGYAPARCADEGKCNSCAFCALICPDLAIVVTK